MRIGRTILVWSLTALMCVDSASACRWRGWSGGGCAPASCYSSGGSSCYSSYSSCGSPCGGSSGYVAYPADNCPICAGNGQAPVTTNRVPEAATPQPTLQPTPPAPTPTEPLPPAELPGEAPAQLEPAPAEPAPDMPPAAKPGEVDDLFKEPAAPAEPAPAAPAGDVDDLFKEPAAPGAAPAPAAVPGAAPAAAEDLFNEPAPAPGAAPAEPAPDAKPAEPAAPGDVDDLFKVEDKKSAATEPRATSDELENLFAEPAVPVTASIDEKALEEEADRLFGEASSDTAMRVWTDNTGKHHVLARLVTVGKSHVRLLKDNGKYTTVSFERLSRGDLSFVQQQVDRAIVANF